MRLTLIPLVIGTMLLVGVVVSAEPAAVSVAPSAVPNRCTIEGTPGDDVKTGTMRADGICTFGGRDYLHGRSGDDLLKGGGERDTLVGAAGSDVMRGGPGRDRLFGVDRRPGDVLVGGAGRDLCFADPGDRVVGCERIFRSAEPAMAEALGDSLGDVMEIAEAIPTPTITTPPPLPAVTVTVTTTITRTVPFPACNPPPGLPPAPCP